MLQYDPLNDLIGDERIFESDAFVIDIGIRHHEGPNKSFDGDVQFAWDNTSIGLFKTCPRKYYFSIIQGWQAKIMPPPLAFGIHFHRIIQLWHELLTAHEFPKEEALLRCVRLAGLLGEKLPSGDNTRGKEQLVRSIVWYLEQFWDDPAKTIILSDGSPAVEYSFRLPFFDYEGKQVLLCGHIDRFARWQGKALSGDYKTTKYALDTRYFQKFKPHTQFPLYTSVVHILAAETQDIPATDGILLDAVQLGVNFNRYHRHIISFSLEECEEYIKGLTYWIKRGMDACADGYFPANEESCDKYGGCAFREICSKAPAMRQHYLRGHFVQRTWDPLRER